MTSATQLFHIQLNVNADLKLYEIYRFTITAKGRQPIMDSITIFPCKIRYEKHYKFVIRDHSNIMLYLKLLLRGGADKKKPHVIT